MISRALLACALPVVGAVLSLSLAGCSSDGPDGDTDSGALDVAGTGDAAPDSGPNADTGDAGESDGYLDAGDAAPDEGEDGGDIDGRDVDEHGLPICDVTGANDALIEQGDYFLAVSLTPFGGLLVNFRAVVVADDDEVLSLELWSISPDGTWESPAPVARACNLPVSEGRFSVSLPVVTIPARGTTVGVEVDVLDFSFAAELLDAASFCGTVDGAVPLLRVTLDASTFRAVPLGTQSSPPAAACGDIEVTRYPRIETCPTLQPGPNEMVSAGLDRTFLLFTPDGASDGSGDPAALPVVFLYHGLGGTADEIVDATGYDTLVNDGGFVLVVPDGANTADGSQVFPVDWNILASQYDDDNRDLVFFDDLLTCVGEQLSIDPDRVYATGMSGGGLMTTFLGVHRADALAAVAPMSGGYLQAWPSDFGPVRPWMVTWGGVADLAVDVNFNDTANALLANLAGADAPVIACDHGGGHVWPAEMTPANWAFLSAHVRGETEDPFATALPDVFPDYCEIR
ncbi:MAG: hypothetical protein H6700_01275 [Myxococcales bacterium]|nr:hypothetical protein [Myxococcales bacterium]MCB9519690.1 hypothetical protein [Myxococcales bacterium]MCB9530380.1 hypothetical protein [Myxococcales bacterium]